MKRTTAKPKDKAKRFVFNIAKDIQLLQKCLEFNPWQLGSEKWTDICNSITELYGSELKVRTAKERVENLLLQFEKQEFTVKTGTEEEKTERGELLEEIRTIKEQSAIPINIEEGADTETQFEVALDISALEVGNNLEIGLENTVTQENLASKKASIEERRQADKERDILLKSGSDVPPEPDMLRRKRTRVTVEEDLILKRQYHEMDMENKKFKHHQESKMKELENEKQRLEIERLREERLADEGKRRDELMVTMCGLLASFKKSNDN